MTTMGVGDDERTRRTTSNESTISLPVDVTIRLLADPNRRLILSFLQLSTGQPVTVEEITSFLADHTKSHSRDDQHRASIEVALHHYHLPTLAATGVIDHDTDAGTVHYWSAPLLEDLLDRIQAANPD